MCFQDLTNNLIGRHERSSHVLLKARLCQQC